MTAYYLRVEAVNLDNFLADTQDLNTIRGGSLLLLKAVDNLAKGRLAHLNALTTGASAGVYTFDAASDQSAAAIRDDVASSLRADDRLKYATFVVDYQPARGDAEFADDLAMLEARNHWRQMQSATVIVDDVTSASVCEKDLVRPATATVPGPEGHLLVSRSVAARRLDGQELKQNFYQMQTGRKCSAGFVRELDELAVEQSKGNLSGKMAVIYLDGNRFGRIKRSASHNRKEWLQFDQTIKKYRRDMLGGLLDRMAADPDWKWKDESYRIETLMWGGDEILWVVPGWKGWETLAYFYEASESWRFNDKPLRHSGGLVFCHHKAPIHRIVRLAKELAGLAKRKSRDENLFAYEVLESFDHVGRQLDKYREERSPQLLAPEPKRDSASLILRGRDMPYVASLVDSIRDEVPRRQLHDVAAEALSPLQLSDDPSMDEAAIQERAKLRKDLTDKLRSALVRAGTPPETIEEVESRLGGKHAAWLHLNALWDYIQSGKEDTSA